MGVKVDDRGLSRVVSVSREETVRTPRRVVIAYKEPSVTSESCQDHTRCEWKKLWVGWLCDTVQRIRTRDNTLSDRKRVEDMRSADTGRVGDRERGEDTVSRGMVEKLRLRGWSENPRIRYATQSCLSEYRVTMTTEKRLRNTITCSTVESRDAVAAVYAACESNHRIAAASWVVLRG